MLTLQQLKTYLQEHGATSLAKLTREFAEQPEQIMCLAQHYISKGKIYCEQKTINCGTKCNNCISSQMTQLSWVNNKN